MSKADKAAAARLRSQSAADREQRVASARQVGVVRPRLEAEIAKLTQELLPLLETHGEAELTAFRVAAGPYGSFRANFKKDRAGWKITSLFKDSSWGGSTVLVYLFSNGEFMNVISTNESGTHDSGGHTTRIKDLSEGDLEPIRTGLTAQIERFRGMASSG